MHTNWNFEEHFISFHVILYLALAYNTRLMRIRSIRRRKTQQIHFAQNMRYLLDITKSFTLGVDNV